MKNKIQNKVLLIFLMANNTFFAQGPNPDDAGGLVDPTDSQAPIDSNLIFLAIAGMVFCYFRFKKKVIIK